MDDGFNISVIAKTEIFGYNKLETFLELANIFALDDEVISETIRMRRVYKKIKLGDAIIAAIALVNHLTLVTLNTKDFKNIMGLELMNPHSL
ncbi:MAG: type II toxin-antitoxin system VapC family toxin [Bacteroidales bacterium]